MDWIRNNKFMAAFLALMVVGMGVLGYLLYTSYGHYDEVSQQYDKQVTELQRLQKLKPFPNNDGLKKYADLRRDYLSDVNSLQAKLASYEPAPSGAPLTPVEFAEKLRKTVEEITTAAQSNSVALPPGFYLGFDSYRGAPPDAAATPLLSRELDSLEKLVRLLIEKKVSNLTLIKRAPLPREPGYNGGATPAPAAQGAAKKATSGELVVRYPVELAFTAQPSSFREVLNQITASDQLYVIRAIEVKNKVQVGPLRLDPTASSAYGRSQTPGAQPSAPAPSSNPTGQNPPLPTPEGPGSLRYVVGLEKVDADLRIELVKVEPPAK